MHLIFQLIYDLLSDVNIVCVLKMFLIEKLEINDSETFFWKYVFISPCEIYGRDLLLYTQPNTAFNIVRWYLYINIYV